MRVAGLVHDSIVDGPGLRFVVFAQGCDIHCEGCHNPDTQDFSGGKEMPLSEIISQMTGNPLTDGLTLSGGEPFLQAADCARIAEAACKKGLNIWLYSGHTFEELVEKASASPDVKKLLELSDVLVDGRFSLSERSLSLKWRGSRNQRVLDVPKSLAAGRAVELEQC